MLNEYILQFWAQSLQESGILYFQHNNITDPLYVTISMRGGENIVAVI